MLLPLPSLPPLPVREGGGGAGEAERESHLIRVVLREYVVEHRFLANIRIVSLDGLLRRHPRDGPVFAPSKRQRVALHRRRAFYEHIEQRIVWRMCGVQEVQEPPQLIAIELAVFIEVILLEPAAQARAAARVAHCCTQPWGSQRPEGGQRPQRHHFDQPAHPSIFACSSAVFASRLELSFCCLRCEACLSPESGGKDSGSRTHA